MKLKNLPFALLVTLTAVAAIAIAGWCASFTLLENVNPNSIVPLGSTKEFFVRVLVGTSILGLCLVGYKVYKLFIKCMKHVPSKWKN